MRCIEFECIQCKKTFISKKACKSRVPKFCSRKCCGLSLRADRFCLVCGDHVSWQNKYFCSKKCTSINQTGKKLSNEHKKSLSECKKGKKPTHLYTKEVRDKISKSLTGKPQPWMRGENHPRYVDGGKAQHFRQKEMGRTEYKSWRRTIFFRDNFTCVLCKSRGRRMCVDHVKSWSLYPELRYDFNNGRTLCLECHKKTDTYGGKSHRRNK